MSTLSKRPSTLLGGRAGQKYLWENICLRPTAAGSRIFVYSSHDTYWHLCEIFWPVIGGMCVGLWDGVSITFVDKIIWIRDSERRAQLCN